MIRCGPFGGNRGNEKRLPWDCRCCRRRAAFSGSGSVLSGFALGAAIREGGSSGVSRSLFLGTSIVMRAAHRRGGLGFLSLVFGFLVKLLRPPEEARCYSGRPVLLIFVQTKRYKSCERRNRERGLVLSSAPTQQMLHKWGQQHLKSRHYFSSHATSSHGMFSARARRRRRGA
jgi:hypothetical protein